MGAVVEMTASSMTAGAVGAGAPCTALGDSAPYEVTESIAIGSTVLEDGVPLTMGESRLLLVGTTGVTARDPMTLGEGIALIMIGVEAGEPRLLVAGSTAPDATLGEETALVVMGLLRWLLLVEAGGR
jgi:hypothetical protein